MEPKLIASIYWRADGAQVLAFLAALLLMSSMPPVMAVYKGKNATYVDFEPEDVDWELAEPTDCEPMTNDGYSLEYRSRYRWAEFCGDLGPYTGACGCQRCLEVTNAATSDGASVTLRIVDICDINYDDDPVLIMGKIAFDQIDTDGQGGALGGPGIAQLMVNYNIVDCQDPAE